MEGFALFKAAQEFFRGLETFACVGSIALLSPAFLQIIHQIQKTREERGLGPREISLSYNGGIQITRRKIQ